MSIDSRELFDWVWNRVETINTIKTLAQTPMTIVTPADLPRMMMTMSTDMNPWGDPTAGPAKFDASTTIYFSYVLAGQIDDQDLVLMSETMDMVEAVLFTDAKWRKMFRGVGHISRSQPNFSQKEEVNVCEMREAIQFLHHEILFPPTINDWFKTMTVITPSADPPDSNTVFAKWDLWQPTPPAPTPPPNVLELLPANGPIAGGTSVTITGDSFVDVYKVQFGSVQSVFTVINPRTITAISPAVEGAGMIYVTVTTPYGASGVGETSSFNYE